MTEVANATPKCNHPQQERVARWERDIHVPEAEILTTLCGVCGAVLSIIGTGSPGPWKLVDVREKADAPAR